MDPDIIVKIYLCVWLAVLGAAAGSFIDCAVWRWARGEAMFRGRSHCAACGHTLGARDLIPAASWLLARGRCRYCGEKIPAECLWAELAGAAGFVLAAVPLDPALSWALPKWVVFAGLLLSVSLADAARRVIPDRLLLAMAANWLVWTAAAGELPGALWTVLPALPIPAALLALVLGMEKLLGREVMGGGDIKLLFVFALYLNWAQLLLALLAACLLGLAWAAVRRGRGALPFGPFLSAGCMLSAALGGPLVSWYLGLF